MYVSIKLHKVQSKRLPSCNHCVFATFSVINYHMYNYAGILSPTEHTHHDANTHTDVRNVETREADIKQQDNKNSSYKQYWKSNIEHIPNSKMLHQGSIAGESKTNRPPLFWQIFYIIFAIIKVWIWFCAAPTPLFSFRGFCCRVTGRSEWTKQFCLT